MRVLWVCNLIIPALAECLGQESGCREGWLTGLFERVVALQPTAPINRKIDLAVAFPVDSEMGSFSKDVKMNDSVTVRCYGFVEDLQKPYEYHRELEAEFKSIIDDFKPDVMHVFGSEFPHALSAIRAMDNPGRTLLGIQGICSEIARVYMADLPPRVQKKVTFRDLIRKDSLRQQQMKFKHRGIIETEAIKKVGNIAGRTDFDRRITSEINPEAKYHVLNETMRPCFYKDFWKAPLCEPYSIFLSQGDYPLKGFHYLIQAMPKILEVCPMAHIYVAGADILKDTTIEEKLKLPAYAKYLRKLVREEKIGDRITMLGKLDAEQMKEQYMRSHVFVCPSALENSPNCVAEAMLLGVPCVVSNVGGVSSIFTDGGDGIMVPAGDVNALATAIIEIFTRQTITEKYSDNAKQHARLLHDADQNYYKMISIYLDMMS